MASTPISLLIHGDHALGADHLFSGHNLRIVADLLLGAQNCRNIAMDRSPSICADRNVQYGHGLAAVGGRRAAALS